MIRSFITSLATFALAAPQLIAADQVITLDLPILPPGKTLTLEYDTTVGSLGGDSSDLSTKATITADGGLSIETSDPATAALAPNDPTLTEVYFNTAPTLDGGEALAVGAGAAGLTSYSFRLDYLDDTAIDASTIDLSDVTVTGPGGPLTVTAGTASGPDGTNVSGTYSVTPPGGSWDPSDNGQYMIGIVGSQIGDTGSPALFVGANSAVTSFAVNIPDPAYTIVATDASKPEGDSGTTDFTFTVSRAGDTSVAGSVTYAISGASPTDFASALSGTVPFPANTSSVTLTIQVEGDSLVETDEAFTVTLSTPQPAGTVIGTPSSAAGTILNDDSSVSIGVSPSNVDEDGAGNLVYTFFRAGSTTGAATINFNVVGTAELGTDYTQTGAASFSSSSGTVTIPDGLTSATVTIDPTVDTEFEADETIILTITPGSYVVSGPADATGVIRNDDTLTLDIAAQDAEADENTADTGSFRISRNGTYGVLSVGIQLSATSTATPVDDFSLSGVLLTGGAGTVTIPDGQNFVDISLVPNDDVAAEASETAILTLSSSPGYSIGTSEDTVTIAANDFVVTNTNDFDSSTDANGGEGTIRQALLNADAISGAQSITFSDIDGTAFTTAPQTITLSAGPLSLRSEVSIDGPALPGRVALDADGASGVIRITNTNSTLTRVTIRNGQYAQGGGITMLNAGATLVSCAIENCSASSGGGLYLNDANLSLVDCDISNNSATSATGSGGAIFISTATVRMRGTTLSNNVAASGGAISLVTGVIGSSVFATNCTFSGNRALKAGGAISLGGSDSPSAVLDNVTITGNQADSNQSGGLTDVGGGIFVSATGSCTINNSIVAGNFINGVLPTASDIHGAVVVTSNHNLIGVDSDLTGISNGNNGNQIGTSAAPIDPLLGPLANNGGFTLTHELLPGSPAINTGDPAFDPNSFTPPLTSDQRGLGFDRIATGQLDIGAFETEADLTPPAVTCPPSVVIECGDSTAPSNTGMATATDDIDPNPVVTFSDVMTPGVGGNASIVRTWTATDAEGNSASCMQTITVQDTTAPVVTSPANLTIECDQPTDPSATGMATAVDSCDVNPVITFADVITRGVGANFTIARTWTGTDANGNSANSTQTITVQDTTAPDITCPPDLSVGCNDPTDPSATGVATAIDSCDPAPVISFVDVTVPGTGDDLIITRTWTATDANGNAAQCAQTITIQRYRPTLVGTSPNDGITDQNAIEDDTPLTISLESFFADVDQDVTTLTYSVETNDNATLVSAEIVGSTLTLTLGANQSGAANLMVRATDECGLSVDSSFVLNVTKQIDLAVSATESVEVVAAGSGLPGNLVHTITLRNNGPSDATGVTLDLTGAVPAGVTVDSIQSGVGTVSATSWSDIDLAEGASATLTRTFSVTGAANGGVDVISTTATVAASNEALANTGDDTVTVSTGIISPVNVGSLEVDVTPGLNLQSGLFDQRIRVTNNNALPIAGFRLHVQNLPADVTLYNGHGQSQGVPYIDYNQSLAPGASVDLALEFFRANLDADFDPTYEIVEVRVEAPEEPPAAATGFAIDRTVKLPNGDVMIEFSATPGSEYAIEYSANAADWKRVGPTITAPANKVQWIDNGSPKTESHPSTVLTRLYRVVLINQ